MSGVNGLVNQLGQVITKAIPIISVNGAAVNGARTVGEQLIDKLEPPRPFENKTGCLHSDSSKLDYNC